MKIDILANDGSPLGVTMETLCGDDPHQIGVGGAELGILTLCEIWAKAGHDVTFYNNPRGFDKSLFHQANIQDFNGSDNRDILIIFRSPNNRVDGAKGLKVWFSTDQYTINDYRAFAPKVDKIVTISQFHAEYFKNTYGIENTYIIDLPVRTWEYEQTIPTVPPRVPKRCIFTSVPDRGLHDLLNIWPAIVRAVPEASLVITSDYRLWGAGFAGSEPYIRKAMGQNNITYLGAVKRPRLVEEQLKAELLLYPCCYDELFCYAVAEAQVAGALPLTTDVGALKTTNMGWFISKGDIVNATILALETPMDGITRSVFKEGRSILL